MTIVDLLSWEGDLASVGAHLDATGTAIRFKVTSPSSTADISLRIAELESS